MDMIIKAAIRAADGIESADRRELDRTEKQSKALREAVSVANYLGCEAEDVTDARRRLAILDEKCSRRRLSLRDSALSNIELRTRNGLDTRGLQPCTTDQALRDVLTSTIARIRGACPADGSLTLTIAHREPIAIGPDDTQLTDQSIQIAGERWLLCEIVAVSQTEGLGLLVRSSVIRVDCEGATPGMPVEAVRQLTSGTKVVLLEETSGESADGEERTYPVGTIGEVSEVRTLPAPQGLAVTVIIGPQDGDEAIVNVFDEGDHWYPLSMAPTA